MSSSEWRRRRPVVGASTGTGRLRISGSRIGIRMMGTIGARIRGNRRGKTMKNTPTRMGNMMIKIIGITIGIVKSFTSLISFNITKNLKPKVKIMIGNFKRMRNNTLKNPMEIIFRRTTFKIAIIPIDEMSKRDEGLSYTGYLA